MVARTGRYIPVEVKQRTVEWEHEYCAFIVEVLAMNPSTLFDVLQLFWVCSCHLRYLVMVAPRSHSY